MLGVKIVAMLVLVAFGLLIARLLWLFFLGALEMYREGHDARR